MPENISFSSIRSHPTNEDFGQFDIIKDGKVVHTVDVDMKSCMGSMDEYRLHLDGWDKGKQWLLERHLLPKPVDA